MEGNGNSILAGLLTRTHPYNSGVKQLPSRR